MLIDKEKHTQGQSVVGETAASQTSTSPLSTEPVTPPTTQGEGGSKTVAAQTETKKASAKIKNPGLGERLTLAKNATPVSITEIARACRITRAGVYRWLDGKIGSMSTEHAVILGEMLHVNPLWLGAGVGSMEPTTPATDVPSLSDDFVAVSEVTIMINSRRIVPVPQPGTAPAVYRRDWLEQQGVDPSACVRIRIEGRAMEPLLYDGDAVTVNTADTGNIVSGMTYAVAVEGRVYVRKLSPLPDGSVLMRANNPDEPPFTIKPATTVSVIGRVIDRQGRGPL